MISLREFVAYFVELQRIRFKFAFACLVLRDGKGHHSGYTSAEPAE
jgi:hypothetical protein